MDMRVTLATSKDSSTSTTMTHVSGQKGNRASAIVRAASARNRAADILPVVHALQANGVTTLRGIAEALNERGIPAPRGGNWSPVQVSRVLALS
jgi:hypothetical protein